MYAAACNSPVTSSLTLLSSQSGEFELYSIDPKNKLSTEWRGIFNKKMDLTSGRYFAQTLCSSETIILGKNEHRQLEVNEITFVPPTPPTPDDKFIIECRRDLFGKYEHQRVEGQYNLLVLTNSPDILVNMQPLNIKISAPTEIKLGALNVVGKQSENGRYFVYPSNEVLATTESQNINQTIFLLPGKYYVELNGSKKLVKIEAEKTLSLETGELRFQISSHLNSDKIAKINGKPLEVLLNNKHKLALNTNYQILTGEHNVSVSGGQTKLKFAVHTNEKKILQARSLLVRLNCQPEDLKCFGKKEVFLFEPGTAYPFASGHADVPILFLQQQIEVGLAGLESIRYRINSDVKDIELKTLSVQFHPQYRYEKNLRTELMRLEGLGDGLKGVSYDLPIDENFRLTLLQGRYRLLTVTKNTSSQSRQRNVQDFYAAPQNSALILRPNLYLNATQYSRVSK